MKAALICFLVFASTFASAREAAHTGSSQVSKAELCRFGDQGVIKTAKASGTPNFFFRTFNHAGKEYVSYATSNNLNLLDLKTSKEFKFAGMYDPVPVGESVMSTPDDQMVFYNVGDIVKGQQTPQAINVANEEGLGGVYQSVGQLSASGNKKVYRIISDLDSATAADYEVQEGQPAKMKMIRKPVRICKNVDFKLPMLSKDGTMMSGYDVQTGTTKIWKIDIATGNCKELEDFGMGVGKADFSYDNSKLTFHTINASDATDYFTSPTRDMNMNVFVYDRRNKKLTKMTQNKADENAYYPVFRPDGTIVYSHIDRNGDPTFVHADPKKGKAVPFDTSALGKEKRAALFSIGQLWNSECLNNKNPGNYAMSVSTALSLDAKTCNGIVDQFWASNKDQISRAAQTNSQTAGAGALTAEKLKAACPKDAAPRAQTTTIQSSSPTIVASPGQEALAKKCSLCHAQFNLRELTSKGVSKELRAKVLQRIQSSGADKMPKVGSLSGTEIKQIKDYVATLH